MRKQVAMMAIPMAAMWLFSTPAVAQSFRHSGPPAVGAGTGRLQIESQADHTNHHSSTSAIAKKGNPSHDSSDGTARLTEASLKR